MKSTWLTAIALAATAAPLIASAQPYATAELGWANADFPLNAPFNGFADDSSITYGITFGMGFGERWAAELGYDGYGNFDGRGAPCPENTVCGPVAITEQSINQHAYEASLVRRFAIANFRFYGKAGYYRAKIDTNVPFPDADFVEDGLLLGVGMRWYFDSPWSVSVEASRFDDNVSQLTFGVGWGFGAGHKEASREKSRDRVEEDNEAPLAP
jgi:hypothetical protein